MPPSAIVPIIGGGPAGMSCALWLKNYGLHPVIIERRPELGGMQRLSPYPDHWLLGRPDMTSRENAETFARHIERESIETLRGASPARVERQSGTFRLDVTGPDGTRTFESTALVIATGTDFRSAGWLDRVSDARTRAALGRVLPGPAAAGEPDADLGARVLIVGGGDNAFDVASHLVRPDRMVTIAMRSDRPRAQPLLVERVTAQVAAGRAEIRAGAAVQSLTDEPSGIVVRFDDGTSLEADRIILCLGYEPNTREPWIDSLDLRKDRAGYIVVDANMETSCPGVFAIGDVSNPAHPCTVTALAAGSIAAREIQKRLVGVSA